MPSLTRAVLKLQEELGPDEAARAIQRLQRVPASLAALEQPAVLETALTLEPGALTPAALIRHSLNLRSLDPTTWEDGVRDHLEGWAADPDAQLRAVASLALATADVLSQVEGPSDQTAVQTAGDPAVLVLAYSDLLQRGETSPEDLLSGSTSDLAVHNALLAERGEEGWMETLQAADSGFAASDLLALSTRGEEHLAARWAQEQLERSPVAKDGAGDPSLTEAILRSTAGDFNGGLAKLEMAWEGAVDRTAMIADLMADFAQRAGDSVLEQQARERSLEVRPNGIRRARMAFACLRQGDPELAMQQLEAQPGTPEEYVAAGCVHLALGNPGAGRPCIDTATDSASQLDPDWMQSLAEGWVDLGEPGKAVNLLESGLARFPGHLPLRKRLAELSLLTGATELAADQAAIIFASHPDEPGAKAFLAEALQASGETERALPLWLQLADADDSYRKQAIDCALEAGEISTALKYSQELVDDVPDSVTARVALGKSLVAAGNPRGGQSHFHRATELAPQNPDPWLALAQSQMETGHHDEAGDTLNSAQTACPEEDRVRAALADWMASQERWTEAVEAIEEARELNPSNPLYMAKHGIWLREIGRSDKAIEALEEAVARRPLDWEPRLVLAELYQEEGALGKAAPLLEDLPHSAPAAAHRLAARVTLQLDPDRSDAKLALLHLDLAHEEGTGPADLSYWTGVAQETLGQHSAAIQSYQSCLKSLEGEERELREACLRGTARSAIASDQVPLAISVLERVREIEDPDPLTLALLAEAYLAGGLADEALPPATRAWQAEPENERFRGLFIDCAKASGRTGLALDKILAWRAEHEADAPLLLQLAELHSQLGSPSEARAAIAEAIWSDRRNPLVLRQAGEALLKLKEAESAKRILAAGADLSPEDVILSRALARAAERAADPPTALLAWEKVLDSEPEALDALVGSAEALWRQDQRVAAIGFLQRAVTQKPSSGELHAKLARLQLANGETRRALEHFRTAAECSPDDRRVVLEAAEALLANGDAPEALSLLEPISKSAMQDEQIVIAMAEGHLLSGQPDEALMVLRRIDATETTPAIHALHSLSEAAAGRPAAAAERLEHALETGPATGQEAGLVIRAALRLGAWDRVAQIAEALLQSSDDERSLLAALNALCRVADAHTLIATLADAPAHGPSEGLVGEDLLAWCSAALDRLADAGLPPSQIESMRARATVATGQAGPASAPQLSALPRGPRVRLQAMEGVALAHLRAENPEGALQVLATGGDSGMSGRWSALIAGLAHLLSGRPSMARKALGAVGNDPILRPLAAYFAGESWAQDARWTEAINNLNTAVLEWPDEAAWQRRLAELYIQEQRPEASLPHLQRASELDPAHSATRLQLARVLAETGQLTEADEAYRHALDHMPEQVDVLTEAASIALQVGQPARAASLFQHAINIEPENSLARVGAARATLAQGDRRGAQKHAAVAMRHAEGDPEVLIGLGKVFSQQGRYEQALALYEDARPRSPNPAAIDQERGRVLVKMGRPDEALALLDGVVQTEPEWDEAWAQLAEAFEAAGRGSEAIDAMRMAIRLRPGSHTYRLRLARILRQQGRLDQALSELSDLQRESPDDHHVSLELGMVHHARRQWREALAAYQHAIETREDSAAAHFQAGMIFKTLKAYPRAARMLQRAVDLNPDDSEALHQLAAVQALELVHGGMQTSAVTP